ncbi:MAG: multicopper oxidase domain-containing protein, partial [Propionibacteriales bacterium]|nr:multicopper oxidase domain-containing protein [Propionibacteriales bacterium]
MCRLAYAALLAYGGVAWLAWLHDSAGIPENSEPPFLLHVLRDGTMALPAVLVAVVAAVWLARRIQPTASPATTRGPRLTTLDAAVLAAAAAVALGVGSPVHGALFGGEEHDQVLGAAHQHHAVLGAIHGRGSSLLHVGFDMLVALPAELGLALMVLMLPGAVLMARRSVRHRKVAIVLGSALAVFGALVGSPVLAQGGGGTPPPSTDPGNPCPSDAPVKSFDITALNVNIPLNRFGDHDPAGKMYTLTENISAVRNEEQSQQVSIGLRDDPIQPLVIRANLGDCVDISYHNRATGGSYGLHLDGLEFAVGSSGDAVGKNSDSGVAPGKDKSYRFWVPQDPNLEGAHYMSAGPGYRSAVGHGLFGSLAVEPAGSTYHSPADGRQMDSVTGAQHSSGWEMTIAPPTRPSFREGVKILHEVGNDNEPIFNKNGSMLPQVDDLTGSYRPGEFAINYRSEPFRNRLLQFQKEKSHSYGSYTFGDPSTPMPRGYLGDPTKFRIVHGGGEKFHVYHLHGGGDRWRLNPVADTTYDYGDTGLNKTPSTRFSPSNRLDSQSMG